MSDLGQRLLVIHEALDAARIAHAFGGAIALGYCVEEPRGTTDLDINVFVNPDTAERVVAVLPGDITVRRQDVDVLARDGQVRLHWGRTPIDLFLNTHEFHDEVAKRVRLVPFEGIDIPVLDCVSLAVFKAFFNRPKDWLDLANMLDSGKLDGAAAVRWLEELLGPDDEVTERLASLVG